jgi:hypothetical protein
MSFGLTSAFSQQPNWGNFDPQELLRTMQQRVMENFREQLEVTDDGEWKIIEERLSKVTRMKTDSMLGSSMGLMGGMGFGRGGNRAGGGPAGLAGLTQSDPDTDNLQKVIEDKAPAAQIQSALSKLREARKQKQALLSKAQEDLRQVLTLRQEAILVVAGMLD